MLDWAGWVLGWAGARVGGSPIGDGREKMEERGEWIPHTTWTSHQHLMIILTPFDHFNDFSYDKSIFRSKKSFRFMWISSTTLV